MGLREQVGLALQHSRSVQDNNSSGSGTNDIPATLYVALALSSDDPTLPATEAGTVGGRQRKSGYWRIL